jgi:restriction endonuclease S subunit
MMELIELGNECEIITKGTTPTTLGKSFTTIGVGFLRAQNVINSNVLIDEDILYIDDETHNNELKRSQIFDGDVLLTIAGTIGRTAIVKNINIQLNCNQAVAIIRLGDSKINKEYLCHFIASPNAQEQFFKGMVTATIANLSLAQIRKLKIPLPPLPQQQKIANILDAADALRQNDKALIAKYDELTQALFLDMFGDPVSNPKGWDVVKLKDISTKIHSGNTPKGGSEVYVETGITFFRSQNVWKKRLVYEDIAFIDQETHSKMMKSSLKHKDILMTKTGRINTENSSLGRAAIYLGEDDKANVNGHVYLIRLKKGALNEFVLHILTTKEYRGHIRSVCVGGIDKRQLNKEHIENFPIINPDMDLQIRFSKQLEVIEEQKSIAQKSLEKSESLFNSLLQKAFKGELV